MKYLLLSIILLAMFACNPDGTVGPRYTDADSVIVKLKTNYSSFKEYTIITVEGCEYFAYKDHFGDLMIEHKGNCKNPIHYQVKHDTVYVLKESGLVLQKQVKK
jgi:hypothetical protein